VETNLEQQTPKLNVTNVSSAVFGKEGSALGEESKIGKLSRIVRTTRLKVNQVEKILPEHQQLIGSNATKIKSNTENIKINADKITRLKKILQTQKSDIGKKLPDSTEKKDNAQFNTTLSETNRILVEIQKQLAQDFGAREQEAKEESEDAKEATSKQRFKREETALEKSAKSIVSTAKKATKKIISPLGNIFQKILAFIGILGKGIALNAAFAWFQDPENQEKLKKFFNILKENWKLLTKILLVIGGAILIGKIIGFIGAMVKFGGFILGLAANPLFLAGIGIIMAAAMQGFGRAEKEVIKDLKDQNKDNPFSSENRKKLIQKYKQEIEDISYDTGGILGRVTLDPGKLSDLRQKIRFLETGRYDYAGQSLSFDFGISDFNYNMGSKFNFGTGQLESLSGDGKSPGFSFGGERAMGGPVTAGRTYLVGEKGPELFSPNIDGSIVNNMRTEKIYQMLASGKRGRTRIVNLPPQVIEGPKPEVNVNQGPATKAPTISSSNPFDGSRLVTPEIYGISV